MAMIDLAMELRKKLLRRDAAALAKVAKAYQQIYERTQLEMENLINKILANGGEMTLGQIQRLGQYKQLLETVQNEVDDFGTWFKLNTRQEAQALIAQASKDAQLLIREAVAGDARLTAMIQSINPRVIETLLGFLDTNGELWKYWSRGEAGETAAKKITQAIIENIGLGRNPRAWKTALADAMGSSLTSALRTARTIQLWSYREANRANYAANDHVVKGWQWLAELDDHVCPACVALHGKVFTLEEPMEGHWNCRCTIVPISILTNIDDIEKGEAWFAKQSEATQKALLGPGKYEAWKNGRFEFSQLATHADDTVFGKMWLETPLKDLIPEEAQ